VTSAGASELATRIGQWKALAAAATPAERTAGAVLFVLPAGPEMIATVTELCAAETACCGQTRFLLDITAGQMTLTAEAPARRACSTRCSWRASPMSSRPG
jgi:hypothetical protein